MSGCAAMKAGDGMVDSKRSALIVASDDYADPGLRRLRAPASEAPEDSNSANSPSPHR